VVKGLIINRFALTDGIGIVPMGDATVSDEDVRDVRVEGNFIGTDPTGTLDRGNLSGKALFAASDSTVGGASLASRNLISGNTRTGVFVGGAGGGVGARSSDDNEVGATS
jgi:hypothetical protein